MGWDRQGLKNEDDGLIGLDLQTCEGSEMCKNPYIVSIYLVIKYHNRSGYWMGAWLGKGWHPWHH